MASHTDRPALDRPHPGRTAVAVAVCSAILLGAVVGIGYAGSRLVELLAWFAGS
jgi:hypothetical protein